jgi:hypothetical protein
MGVCDCDIVTVTLCQPDSVRGGSVVEQPRAEKRIKSFLIPTEYRQHFVNKRFRILAILGVVNTTKIPNVYEAEFRMDHSLMAI